MFAVRVVGLGGGASAAGKSDNDTEAEKYWDTAAESASEAIPLSAVADKNILSPPPENTGAIRH